MLDTLKLFIWFLLVIISTQTTLAQDIFLSPPSKANVQTTYDCGGEGEEPCGADTIFFWENGNYFCDRGLKPTNSTLKQLYSLDKGEFLKAISLLRREEVFDPLGSCVNDTRYQAAVDDFQRTWLYWAIQEQLRLAKHDPINNIMFLAGHNAYNNTADGYLFPNQYYSITDQLRIGGRVIMLDVHYGNSSFWEGSAASLCHGLSTHVGCSSTNRMFSSAVKEIATWLKKIENRQEVVILEIEDEVSKGIDGANHINDPIKEYLGELIFKPTDKNPHRWPTIAEMVEANKRIVVLWQGTPSFDSEYLFNGKWSGDYKDSLRSAYLKLFRSETCTGGNNTDLTQKTHYFEKFSEVYEDRVKLSPNPLGLVVGKITQENLAELANCNVNIIGLDQILYVDGFNRLKGAVWSWQEGDEGQFGDGVVQTLNGRWASRDTTEKHRFACLGKRSESSGQGLERLDPLDYSKIYSYRLHQDKLGTNWQITARSGTWFEGGLACLEEFGSDYVFSVPTNGYQNKKLFEANVTREELWLNYNDIKQEGAWLINRRPVAKISLEQKENKRIVIFDAGNSLDPEGDHLNHNWEFGDGSQRRGKNITHAYAKEGEYTVSLIIYDDYGGVDSDSIKIQIF